MKFIYQFLCGIFPGHNMEWFYKPMPNSKFVQRDYCKCFECGLTKKEKD